MKWFVTRFTAIAVVAYGAHVVGAFAIGTQISSRYSPSSGIDSAELQSPLFGGLTTALGVAAFITLGFVVRFFTYRRLDRAGVSRRILWWSLVLAEAAYIALNWIIIWSATEPAVDAGYGWFVFVQLALIVTGLSLVGVAVTILAIRRRAPAVVPN